jgi:hypothetical protein
MDEEKTRKSKRLESKQKITWTHHGAETPTTGACGTTEDCAHFVVETHSQKDPKNRHSTDFQRFHSDIKNRQNIASGEAKKRDVLAPREYDTSDKEVVASQPLQPYEPQDDQLETTSSETSPHTTTTALPEENADNSQPELPTFTEINMQPSATYNNMEPSEFQSTIHRIYEVMVAWRKNLFLLPTGKAGKDFIELTTEWLRNYNTNNSFHGLAMKVVMILPGLLLQKPNAKSKAKEHTKALDERLKLWKDGKLDQIVVVVVVSLSLLTAKSVKS